MVSAATHGGEETHSRAAAGLRRIVLNALSLLFAYLLHRVFTFTAVVVAARVLGPRDFGAYGTAAAYAVILSIVANLGMTPLLVREMARSPGRAPALLRAAHLVKTASNLLMLVILFVLARWVLGYPQPVVSAALLLGISYAVAAYAENLGAYFQAIERMHVWTQASALLGLVTGGLGIALALTTRSVVWFCAASIAGWLAAAAWLVARAPAGARRGAAVAAADLVQLLKALVPFAAAFVALTVYYKVDFLLLARWRPAQEVGVYTASYKFVDILQALVLVVAAAVYPRLSRAAPAGAKRGRWAATRVTELLVLAAVPVAGTLWLARTPLILGLYGSEYAAAAPVLGVLALLVPALAINILGGYVLGATGRMAHVAALYAGGVTLNVALNAILIPRLGPVGAAAAMLASETLLALGFLAVLHVHAAALPDRRTGLAALGAAALCGVAAMVPDATRGVLAAALYLPAVALLYWRVAAPPARERAILRDALRPGKERDGVALAGEG